MDKRKDCIARPYQLELLEAALEDNTIVNLGTGAGKTYIAVMLIKELSSQVLLPFSDENAKRTVFLVTTVPLVKQQADYIKLHTQLDVGQYTGDMNVDSWHQWRWNNEFEKNQVLVMTMTIFKNLILEGKLKFSQVNLLIFDECHHAVKNHDYVQIMRRFKDLTKSYDLHYTRVLGLTASLIPSKCKPGDLEKKIEELEKTLCCRSQTAEDLAEVAKYATNPMEVTRKYKSGDSECDIVELKQILEEPVNFLEAFDKTLKESEFYEIVKLNLEDCLHILLNLGIWCAHQFALNGLQDISSQIIEKQGIFGNDWEESLIHLGRTHLKIFIDESEKKMKIKGRIHMTDKVMKLLLQLGDSATTDKLFGIIFTERRTTAAFLCQLLQNRISEDQDLRDIRCDYVVGHNEGSKKGTYLRKEAHMSIKKQEEVLGKFRKGKINVLISTSVVEEGVDVPRCNMVVRFDFPQNFRSYVQSKGRARARDSKYILLIDEDNAGKLQADLRDYNSLVKELERICHGRHNFDEEEILKQLQDKVEPYRKGRATATINSSLSLVYKYCQKLPKDSYTTVLAPDFATKRREIKDTTDTSSSYRIKNQKMEYCTTLSLPMSSPVKEPIEGKWFPTKRLADKSAALEAVKMLDQAGELDVYLKPISKDDDTEDEEEDMEEVGGKSRLAGTGKKMNYYPNKTATPLTDCFPVCSPDRSNHLYMFIISDATTNNLHLSLQDSIEQLSFGILTSKTLPHLKIPEFSLYDDKRELHVKISKYHSEVTLNGTELDVLKQSHAAIFGDVLKIRPSWLKCCFESAEKNYLVVPINVIPVTNPMEAYIDFNMARKLADMRIKNPDEGAASKADHLHPIVWPMAMENFRNTIVVPKYEPPNNIHKIYEVKEVSSTVTLSSPFPDSKFQTYKEYFEVKYSCSFTDLAQPALLCKPLGESSIRLQLLKSRFKNPDGTDIEKSEHRGRTIELFPEVCDFYPLPANLWKLSLCIPSILWRVECILAVNLLRSKISEDTGIGRYENQNEITTCIDFKGYRDLGFGNLNTQIFGTNVLGEPEVIPYLESHDPLELPLRGPDNVLFLQALTTKSAGDSIDLERLETLGDSFLKFSTTVHLYSNRLTAHEGRLSAARSRRVGNLNLYRLANRRRITDTIFSSMFDPRQMWTPPCFTFERKDPNLTISQPPKEKSGETTPSDQQHVSSSESFRSDQEKHYLFHKVSDKGVADCVESLIGAYLVSGGIEAGLKFMKWMGIKIVGAENGDAENDVDMKELEDGEISRSTSNSSTGSYISPPHPKQVRISKKDESPIFIKNSASILEQFFGSLPKRQLNKKEEIELKRLLAISMPKSGGNTLLGWRFKDCTLLLQAVTHASYTKNRITDCYQRLEFLGDAVLDYLVTCHIYSTFPTYGPGEISQMRSALVNNITFAELAVKLELNKNLLYNSPFLYKQIELYLKREDKDPQVEEDEHDAISNDEDSVISDEPDSSAEDLDDTDPPKVLGDILESLAGAIFVDSGMDLESVWGVFQPHFSRIIESFNGKIPIAPIEELYKREPGVKVTKKKVGPKRILCTLTSTSRGPGGTPLEVTKCGSTLKAAKARAAKAMLRKMNELS